jgi:hypothetical protein
VSHKNLKAPVKVKERVLKSLKIPSSSSHIALFNIPFSDRSKLVRRSLLVAVNANMYPLNFAHRRFPAKSLLIDFGCVFGQC